MDEATLTQEPTDQTSSNLPPLFEGEAVSEAELMGEEAGTTQRAVTPEQNALPAQADDQIEPIDHDIRGSGPCSRKGGGFIRL
jgi:hypothetical protein